MSHFTPPNPQSIDESYYLMLEGIIQFFRYAKRHPDDIVLKYLNDDYYAKVADTVKQRVDHEIKHLHSPYLD